MLKHRYKKYLKSKKLSRSLLGNSIMGFFLILMGVFTALPIVYAIISSFKPLSEIFIYPPRFFVTKPTFENYTQIFSMQFSMLVPLERYVFNSVFVSVIATIGYLFIASLAAYPLSKHQFYGKVLLSQTVIFAILFRTEVLQIPQYIIFSKLGMVDTYWALIVPVFTGSFGVFLMRQFMENIPDAILESSRIDGAGEWRIFFSLIMPVVKPAWLTLMIFTFQSIWNSTGIQYIYSENLKTLPTALGQMTSSGLSMAGVSSAVAVLLMIPPMLLFILTQSNVIETMAHSGIKD